MQDAEGGEDKNTPATSSMEEKKKKRKSGGGFFGWRSATVSDKKPLKAASTSASSSSNPKEKGGGSGFLTFRRKEVGKDNGEGGSTTPPKKTSPPTSQGKVVPQTPPPSVPPIMTPLPKGSGNNNMSQWSPRDSLDDLGIKDDPKPLSSSKDNNNNTPTGRKPAVPNKPLPPVGKKLPDAPSSTPKQQHTPTTPSPTSSNNNTPSTKPPSSSTSDSPPPSSTTKSKKKDKKTKKTKKEPKKGKDNTNTPNDTSTKKKSEAKSWRIQRGRSFKNNNASQVSTTFSPSSNNESKDQRTKKNINRATKNTEEKLGEALIDAAMLGNPDDITRLLDLGADTSFVDSNGYTAVHWAASNGHAACLSLLIERGANINAVDYLNWTPLHYAVFSGQQTKSKTHIRVIEMLLEAGADKEKKNNKGKKAVDLTNNKTVINLLKKKRPSTSVTSKYTSIFKRKSKTDSTKQTKSTTTNNTSNNNNKQQKRKTTDPTKSKDPETEAFFALQVKALERFEELIKSKERAVWSKEEELYGIEKGLKMDVIKLKRVVEEDRAREAIYKKRLEEVEKFEKMLKEKEGLLLEKQRERLVNSVDYDELELGECLGGGASAKVYKAIWREDVVAVKQIGLDDPLITEESAIAAFQRETVLLGQMRHLNIVLLMGVCVNPPNLCIIMEQMTRGDLFSLLHRQKENVVPWDLRLQIALDIARGMNYLHRMSPPMIHRDLKSKNILLDDTFRAKLADFGTTRIKQETLLHTSSNIGTPAWMAPECLRGEDFDEKSDIYSFGIVLYEIMERKVPWENRDPVQIIGAVGFAKDRLPLPSSVPYGCPEGLLNLITCCWAHDPKERPPFGHILPYLRTWIQECAAVL